MTNIALVLVVVVIFIIGIVSPHVAGKIQRKTDNKANWLKRMANWLRDPLTWWAKNSIEFTRKTVVKVAQWVKRREENSRKTIKTKNRSMEPAEWLQTATF